MSKSAGDWDQSKTHHTHTMGKGYSSTGGRDRFGSRRDCSACEGTEFRSSAGWHYDEGDYDLREPCMHSTEGQELSRAKHVQVWLPRATAAELEAELNRRGIEQLAATHKEGT